MEVETEKIVMKRGRNRINLEEKRRLEEEAKKERQEKALKCMKYLLQVSEKYSNHFKNKLCELTVTQPKSRPALKEKNIYQPTLEEMQEVKNITKPDESKKAIDIDLTYFVGGSLRPYQIDGVKWLVALQSNAINGILADEMGLGKTIQIIALICHLIKNKVPGPYLIVAPLSTIPNWRNEFKKFAPEIPVVIYQGTKDERPLLRRQINKKYNLTGFITHPVVISSYQTPLMDNDFFSKFIWQYIIVDEGHRVKNEKSKLSRILRELNSVNKLLLTGTPLQNNVTELWTLLNFIMPHIFKSEETFTLLFQNEDFEDKNKVIETEASKNLISTVQGVLEPFMLRRLKSEVLTDFVPKKEVTVFCNMSPIQKDLYKFVLDRNIEALLETKSKEVDNILPNAKRRRIMNRSYREYTDEDDVYLDDDDITKEKAVEPMEKETYVQRLTMQNTGIMFRKIVNHPYLVNFPLDPNSSKRELLVDENIVKVSGKMVVLEAMLEKLKKNNHKVLIFSTLVMMLDIIEDYLLMKDLKYRRIDGSRDMNSREKAIDEFNTDPDVFIFLLSTRAGGLGLNLTAADTVIFFDKDWNPQADNQAQDRCHRIGQTKPVVVYELIAKNTIDETIVKTAQVKLRLEKVLIQKENGRKFNEGEKMKMVSELEKLKKILDSENEGKDSYYFSDKELDALMDRSDLWEQMK